VEQIWAFINSTLPEHEGRRLNGPICGVASLGAIGGGLAVQGWVRSVGSVNLVLFGALSLLPTALGAIAAYRAAGEPEPAPFETHGQQGHLGLRVLWHDPLLRVLALVVIASQIVSTVFDLQLSRFVETALPVADERTRWFGRFYAGLNGGSALFQFVVTPLLLATASLRLVHAVIPLTHVALAVAALVCPSLWSAAAALAVFKVLDYSVFRGAKELLYVPLSFDARYRSKELIDAFGYRFAKGGASAILAVAGRMVAIPVATLAATAALASVAWLALSPGLCRRPPTK
jgi:AAA family ATP:ADP antiporter